MTINTHQSVCVCVCVCVCRIPSTKASSLLIAGNTVSCCTDFFYTQKNNNKTYNKAQQILI